MKQFEYVIKDELGVHARPAGLLVKFTKAFKSDIIVAKGEKRADAKKLIALMGLAIKQNDRILIELSGEDEEKAADELKKYISEIL